MNSMNSLNSAAGPRPAVKEGDWVCPEGKCAAVNDVKRSTCEQCGRTKPRAKGRVGHEIGKDAAEKSKGLFSADDWQCSKCGNVNWARRNQCNICNAPKFGEVEVRTGYGGGYMDRQDVEYVRRADSDEEYDEFGRKKKKFRSAKDGASNGSDDSKGEKDGEDDEEDEDDGDLAKYCLDDDDEAAVEQTKPKKSTKEKLKEEKKDKKSRSSSRSSSYSRSSRSGSYSSSGSSSRTGSYSGSSSRSGSSSSGSRSASRSRSRSPRKSRDGGRSNRRSSSGSRSRTSRRSRSHRSSCSGSRSPRGGRRR